MLVISRKVGEKLHIGDDITITITKCGRNRVTVGVDAPQQVRILRAEVAEADEKKSILLDSWARKPASPLQCAASAATR